MSRLANRAPVKAVLEKFPGSEIVDARRPAKEDEAPTPGLASGKGKSLSSLADLVDAEAHRIRCRQDALIESGDREAPHANAVIRAESFEAIARILKFASGDQVIKERLRNAPQSEPAAASAGPSAGFIKVQP
jgi:hypothetical protein